MTTIYLIRHSKPMNMDIKQIANSESLQIIHEKNILSVEGEKRAEELSKIPGLKNIDYVISSNYARAMATAKYICRENNKDLNIVEDFAERKFGINDWSELPKDFEKRQFEDENYKIGNGESQKEVTNRVHSTIIKILNKNKDKTIAIVSHATAISYLFKLLGNIEIKNDSLIYKFQNKTIFEGIFNYCETFKLTFNDKNELLEIKNIKYSNLSKKLEK